MTDWLKRQARSLIIAAGFGAVLYVICSLFSYRPDTLSLYLGVFLGSLITSTLREWD